MFSPLRKTDPDFFRFHWVDIMAPPRIGRVFVDVGAIKQPTVFRGYFLVCTTAEWTEAREPNFPRVEGALVTDGAVVWTMTKRPVFATISSQTFVITPAGIAQSLPSNNDLELTSTIRLDAVAAAVGKYTVLAAIVDSTGEEHSQTEDFEVIV